MPRGRKSRAEKRKLIVQLQNLKPFYRKGTFHPTPTRPIPDPTRQAGLFLHLKEFSRRELSAILEETRNLMENGLNNK